MAEAKGFLVVPVGYRADGTVHALELTDGDFLKADIQSIVEHAVDLKGYYGGAWGKAPLPFGVSRRVCKHWTSTSTGGGTTSTSGTPIAAGKLFVCQQFVITHNDTAARRIILGVDDVDSGNEFVFFENAAVTNAIYYPMVLNLVMAPGDYFQSYAYSLANTKILNLYAWGYEIDLAPA